ncbi:MAG: hypothetical protein LZ174_09725 [Thaumarchaeota archaeon]|jgi:hypothetical protein|nr:hypothetical protein [Candidatus Geocrenenecus arthurdayi]
MYRSEANKNRNVQQYKDKEGRIEPVIKGDAILNNQGRKRKNGGASTQATHNG